MKRTSDFNRGIKYSGLLVSLFVCLLRLDFHVSGRIYAVLSCSSSCIPDVPKVIVSFDKIWWWDWHNTAKAISKGNKAGNQKRQLAAYFRVFSLITISLVIIITYKNLILI
jgi:hypothetical protein